MVKNVLYISYDGMTDPLGQSQVIPYLIGLSKEGYNFTILSCEKVGRYKQRKDQIQKILSDSGIGWEPVLYHKNPPVLSTLYDYFKLRTVAEKIHKQNKMDLIHCRSYISSLIGLHFKKKYKIPFIFDMRGFWADERVDGDLWNLKNPLYKLVYYFFKKKEYQFLAFCDACISLTEAGKLEMLKWDVCMKYQTPIYVIPCSTDFSFFRVLTEKEKTEYKNKLRITYESLILSYLGSIGTWYMLEEMLDFYKELLNYNKNTVFLFITPDKPESILHFVKQKNIPLDNIIIKSAEREDVAGYIGISDISIFFIKPAYSKISSSPTKLGELLSMGVPVICNSGVGDVKEIVEKVQGGVVIEAFTSEEYKRTIPYIEKLTKLNKDELREKAVLYYDLDKAVAKYSSIYKTILIKK